MRNTPSWALSGAGLLIALIALLFGDDTTRYPPAWRWVTPAVVWFAAFNAVAALPGTQPVRIAAIVLSIFALFLPLGFKLALLLLACLVWLPAYLVTWSLARHSADASLAEGPRLEHAGRARTTFVAIILAVGAASLLFRLTYFGGVQQTAALFVGIPTILAVLTVLIVDPKTAIGVACKAVTVGLFVSMIFLGEGVLCILMTAPLFYAVAIGLASAASRRSKPGGTVNRPLAGLVLLAALPFSFDGVTTMTTIARDERVVVSKIVDRPEADVRRAVERDPRFDRPLPWLLRRGFPRPTTVRILGGTSNERWVITFRGGETRLSGLEPREGELDLELVSRGSNGRAWRAVSDSSHMTHFLDWQASSVEWVALDADRTQVTWTLAYRRGLDPAWYFGPMERHVVRRAAEYLIDTVATP